MKVKSSYSNQPNWNTITVKSHIPAKLQKLDELAHNLWGSWNQPCRDLFKSLDPELHREVNRNPVELLYRMDYDALKEASEDPEVRRRN